ncbi:PP2C family protein-serine/threonine phosphatase [Eisenibacter elegans]|uniref:PP2C family protein-serine/threonine phosphatase n=1 Tax=Eisenibacter elegans TaxID=997 RepID=UPI0003FE0EB4|nr:SpoIIE family protein phosphatase [Eisenibacter elegans]
MLPSHTPYLQTLSPQQKRTARNEKIVRIFYPFRIAAYTTGGVIALVYRWPISWTEQPMVLLFVLAVLAYPHITIATRKVFPPNPIYNTLFFDNFIVGLCVYMLDGALGALIAFGSMILASTILFSGLRHIPLAVVMIMAGFGIPYTLWPMPLNLRGVLVVNLSSMLFLAGYCMFFAYRIYLITVALRSSRENIYQQKEELQQQSEEILQQRDVLASQKQYLEESNRQVIESIEYAKLIQQAILPGEESLRAAFEEYFVFFRPKDIVSGDFYWLTQQEEYKILVLLDCTGHGVPGAMMSTIGESLLNHIMLSQGLRMPADILRALHKGVYRTLKQGQAHQQRDGMDAAVVVWHPPSRTLYFAGAKRPLVYTLDQGQSLLTVRGTSKSIGGGDSEEKIYDQHQIALPTEAVVYLFSDGYADQMGGPLGKKFMLPKFRALLQHCAPLPMAEQQQVLSQTFDTWKNESEETQTDDVLVVGLKL